MLKLTTQSRDSSAMKMFFLLFILLIVASLESVSARAAEPKVAVTQKVGEKEAMSSSGSTSTVVRVVKTARVHGTAFSPEYPERLRLNGERKNAWGTRYIAPAGSVNWFHVSIPVVSEREDAAVPLKSIFLLFNAKNCTVEEVHLWDGANKIGQFTRLKLSGDNSGGVTAANKFVLPPGVKITSSLGVSVGVSFDSKGGPGGMGELILTSVGAEYY